MNRIAFSLKENSTGRPLAIPKTGLMMEYARRYAGTLFLAIFGVSREFYLEMGLDVGNLFYCGV